MNKKIIIIPIVFVVFLFVAGFFLKSTDLINIKNLDSDSDNIVSGQMPKKINNGAQKVDFYTLSDVKSHNSDKDCWSVINDKVYNLTDWISKHPGGSDRIMGICGIDGSISFNSQHEGERKPVNYLSSFYIGDLSK